MREPVAAHPIGGLAREPGEAPRPSPPALTRWLFPIALVQVAVLLATSTSYGYHRDELYFIVAGGHPALGYPDQPPLVPLLCWAMNAIAPGSLFLLRTPSALAAGATTLLAGLVAREVGGGRDAQLIAAACTAVSGFSLAVAHLVSTTTFDMLSTTVFGWLAVRATVRREGAPLLLAGLVVGVGCLAKPQVGLVAIAMVGAVALLGPRSLLRNRWAAAGALCALGLAAPYIVWQASHGWPQATVASNIAGSQEGGRVGFLPFQLVMVSPVLIGVWIAGLAAPFRQTSLRDLRFIPAGYALLALAYIIGNGHAYYLASLYPLLLGLGAPSTARWLRGHSGRRTALVVAILASAAINAVIALPLLPERDLQGSVVMALNPAQGETVGWPRFVQTVAGAWRRLPPAVRRHTALFTANYGEGGAIDLLGARYGLPRAFSGHNGFSEWGIPPSTDTHAIVTGFETTAELRPYLSHCTTLATVHNGVGLANQEQGLPVRLCRPEGPWPELWPHLTHFD